MIQLVNDSRSELILIRALNALGAIVAAGFAVAATIDPGLVLPGEAATDGARFYAQVYAARALPLTLVLLVALGARATPALVPLLVLAGLVQAVDAALGLVWHRPSMIVGGGLLAVVHLASAYRLRPATHRITVRSTG